DIPYASCFLVHHQHVFSEEDNSSPDVGNVAGPRTVMVDNLIGVAWSGRCMVKSIVERSSRAETVTGSKEFISLLWDALQ
ncbi:unnamed protein product, partial [Polarella glacialis]